MIVSINNSDYQILIDTFKATYEVTVNKFDPFLNIFGYVENGKIVGFISYSIIYDRIELNHIAVLEEYRNKHIATKLMDYMFKNNLYINSYSLEVNVNNIAAINLYKKYGFKQEAIRKNYYVNEDALLMIRK